MLIHIRGTNGSGKSTLVRNLLGPDFEELSDPRGVQWVANKDRSVVAVGKYRTACGGLDTIKTTIEAQVAAQLACQQWGQGLVLMEGILASTVFSTWAKFAGQIAQPPFNTMYVAAFLQTPFEVCLDRIRQRRLESKSTRQDFDVQLVRDKFETVQRVRQKCIDAGLNVLDLEYGNEVEHVRSLL